MTRDRAGTGGGDFFQSKLEDIDHAGKTNHQGELGGDTERRGERERD